MIPVELFETESLSQPCPELKKDDTVQWFHQGKENAFGSTNLLITSANVSLFECLDPFFVSPNIVARGANFFGFETSKYSKL